MKWIPLFLAALFSQAVVAADAGGLFYYQATKRGEAKTLHYDVAVYGGTPTGVTAAIQAVRDGKNVALLSFNGFVGGLTSGGLTATDVGKQESIGGLAHEFYQRIGVIKDFSPAHAEALYLQMLKEANVTVFFHRPLESVKKEGTRISSATFETGETVQAKMFIDATYEGDLYAAAGVSYYVGREPRSAYDESLAGQWQSESWKGVYQFCGLPISPYKTPANPKSGLLPEISDEPFGKPGDGDYRLQAYNFRMFLTNKPDKVKFPKPAGYDPGRYTLLARFLHADPKLKWTLNYTTRPMTDGPVQMRNGDSNNAGSFSTDYVGGNHKWADGTYEPKSFFELPPPRRGLAMPLGELYQLREKIFQDHVSYQQGLMYFLANNEVVPEELRDRVNAFGLDPNEFQKTGHWPHALYVREGRRMVSDYVMTQANCELTKTVYDSVGLASYPMDSHFCQRVVVEENGVTTVRNEGGLSTNVKNPYPISYRSIVPMQEECTNLLVPGCLSASHVAYGSIRMEPVFMILGQSAGAAATMAIDAEADVQDLDYAKLKSRLIKIKQKL